MTQSISPPIAPTRSSFRFEKNIMVPMRDGVHLATNLWLTSESPAPVLLMRTPYGKDSQMVLSSALAPDAFALVEAGYTVVIQDVRGVFASEGELAPLANEADDGADTIAWLRSQPWCDGNVAMFGMSYVGYTQYAAAASGVEGLCAIAPALTSPDFYTGVFYSRGGALGYETSLVWTALMAMNEQQRAIADGTGEHTHLPALVNALTDFKSQAQLPPGHQPLFEATAPWWQDWMTHPARDEYWCTLSTRDQLDHAIPPALHIGGWFDLFASDTTDTYARLSKHAGGQRLIIGPWTHIDYGGVYPDRSFGTAAAGGAAQITTAHIQFFDRWVRGQSDTYDDSHPVRIFVMGIDQWRDETAWPLADTTYTPFYLDSTGAAGTDTSDGTLSAHTVERDASDTFIYDPHDPVPSVGGRTGGSLVINDGGTVDQRRVEDRDDVLVFSTDILDEPIEVTGPISLVLHVSSSALDTDFTGKLVDVHPDGRALYLTDGIIRARYRNSLATPQPLVPGEEYEITIDLGPTSNVFLPGHRIRLEISSSSFPRYDRNTNTGADIGNDTEDQYVIARNTILHGPHHPSRLILPLIHRPQTD